MGGIARTRGERAFGVCNIVLMCIVIVVTLYPMWYILCASVSDPFSLIEHSGPLVIPVGWNAASYGKVFANSMIGIGYTNTLFIVTVGTLLNLVMTILAAYVLSRRNFMIKRPMTLMIVFTMFFQGGLIPSFLVVQGVGLLDSRWALILPGAINTWNMIIMRTNFASFPTELEDSAKIDGANDFVFLARIMLPTCKAVIAVIVLFYATSHWSAWLQSVLYLRTKELYPLQLILREILIANDMSQMKADVDLMDNFAVAQTIKYATIVVSTAPILLIYPFIQKYFVKGVMIGAVKG